MSCLLLAQHPFSLRFIYNYSDLKMEGSFPKIVLAPNLRLRLSDSRKINYFTYLLFVIFFTQTKILENKIYTGETRKLRQNTQ